MENFDKIDLTLQELGEIWKQHPELKLGQLFSTLATRIDLSCVEDDFLIEALKIVYNKGGDVSC